MFPKIDIAKKSDLWNVLKKWFLKIKIDNVKKSESWNF
jgi:hypothetical protein